MNKNNLRLDPFVFFTKHNEFEKTREEERLKTSRDTSSLYTVAFFSESGGFKKSLETWKSL